MSISTYKAGIDADINAKQGIPASVPATRLGQAYKDLADEVATLFAAIYGGIVPADADTLAEISTKLTAMNGLLGSSGKTIDQLISDIAAKDSGAAVDTKISTAINALIGGAPGALNALNELATAIGNDPNFATTLTNALAGKEASIGAKGTAFNKNFGTTAGTVSEGNHTHTTDQISESGSPTNKWWTNARTISSLLTGYAIAGTNAALAATDTIAAAFGKVEKRINDIMTALGNKADTVGGKILVEQLPVTIPLTNLEKDNLTPKFYPEDVEEGLYAENDTRLHLVNKKNNWLKILTLWGKKIVYESALAQFQDCTSGTMTSGSTRGTWVYVEKQTTVANLCLYMRTAGNYTPTGFNGMGLYSFDPATKIATRIAMTADTPNLFANAALTLVKTPLTAPITLQAGWYLVSLRWEASATVTAPTVAGKVLPNSSIVDADGVPMLYSRNTSFEATVNMDGVTASGGVVYWMGLEKQ